MLGLLHREGGLVWGLGGCWVFGEGGGGVLAAQRERRERRRRRRDVERVMVVVVVAFVVVVVMVRGPVATMTVEVGTRHTEPAGRQVGGIPSHITHLGQLTHLHQPRMPGLMHRPSQSIYNACPPTVFFPPSSFPLHTWSHVTLQRRLAWTLHKDDTLLTEMLNVFFFTLLMAFWSRQGEEICSVGHFGGPWGDDVSRCAGGEVFTTANFLNGGC